MDWLEKLSEAVINGRKKDIGAWAAEAVQSGLAAQDLINQAILPAMNIVSEKWRQGEYFVPEVLRSATTMQAGIDALKPYLVGQALGNGIKVAIGTVKGDLHDIGKNLVAIMLEGVGYQVDNMGVDLPPERFIEAAQSGARVIGLSSLLTTSMAEMGNVIEKLKTSGLRDSLTVIVGGAPITPEFAKKIGADYYAENAAAAVDILNRHFV